MLNDSARFYENKFPKSYSTGAKFEKLEQFRISHAWGSLISSAHTEIKVLHNDRDFSGKKIKSQVMHIF